ncbi:MAG: hypothetical protein PHH04_02125 [Thomasclavelia sp.]|nr:hypothetical protein [Thomasclavelia sp.]
MINKCKLVIDKREFELSVYYETYEDNKVLDEQVQLVNKFVDIKLGKEIVDKLSEYIISDDYNDLTSVDNVYKYIMPQYLYVPRDTKKDVIAIMCDYKFEVEHGLAIVFEKGKLKEIGTQDIIL